MNAQRVRESCAACKVGYWVSRDKLESDCVYQLCKACRHDLWSLTRRDVVGPGTRETARQRA
jgi:hypothetical protein